jgi:hypothetical protein
MIYYIPCKDIFLHLFCSRLAPAFYLSDQLLISELLHMAV